MLGLDFILVVGLVAVVIVIIVLAAINNEKIKKFNTKKPDSVQTALIPKPEEIKMELEQGNYLQDYFSQYGPNVNFEDMDEAEESKEVQSAKKKINELQSGLIDMNLLNENNLQEFDEDDFDGGFENDFEEEDSDEVHQMPKTLQDEFNLLSPQMKAFIMSNALENDKLQEIIKPTNSSENNDK